MPFPLDYKFIIATEEQLGFNFPEQYKAKMQIDNGGEFGISMSDSDEYEEGDEIEAWWLFPFQDTSDIKRIKRTMGHLVEENKSIREIEDFPANSVAIAHNDAGDYLLMRAENTQLTEEIYLWRHDDSEFIYLIAASIKDLIQNE
ncbi:SMI1/KNR4 family protein [Acinetobacter sp. ANC 5054]|uniref:SMI1/KNR4 family protein n=1 Tax=Acinetobacter sp. ANC 5054 TaxID=1977877 RepID=UPI00148AB6EA|nr:SMI1/KNR4 family protein [Acinetobacter sp. ANC 5054]